MIKNLLCAAALILCLGACGNKSGENNANSADSTKNETQMQDSQRLPAKDDAKVLIHTTEGNILTSLFTLLKLMTSGVYFLILLAIFLLMNVLTILRTFVCLLVRITSCITHWQSLDL